LLREALAAGSELGLQAKAAMEAGQLVCDGIVLGLIRDRLGRADVANGFILDGYPRNTDQADALNALLRELGQPIGAVLLLDVAKQTLMQRLAGRRVCPKCRTVYNVHSLPAGVTTCERDGETLFQRHDDHEEVIGKRLEVYDEQTRPLSEYYSRLGLLRVVAGEGELDDVFERMEAAALAPPVPASKVQLKPAQARLTKSTKRKAATKQTRARTTKVRRGRAAKAATPRTKAKSKSARPRKALSKAAKGRKPLPVRKRR
jgi:adenylate kinase